MIYFWSFLVSLETAHAGDAMPWLCMANISLFLLFSLIFILCPWRPMILHFFSLSDPLPLQEALVRGIQITACYFSSVQQAPESKEMFKHLCFYQLWEWSDPQAEAFFFEATVASASPLLFQIPLKCLRHQSTSLQTKR